MAVEARLLLEIHVNGEVVSRMIAPPTSYYRVEYAPANALEWTLGGVRHKQKLGFKHGKVSLGGVSGSSVVRAGYNRDGAEVTAPLADLFVEFIEWIKAYQDLGKRYDGPFTRDARKAPRLVFRSMLDTDIDEAFNVEIDGLTLERDTSLNRTQRGFRLELTTEGLVQSEPATASRVTEQPLPESMQPVEPLPPGAGVAGALPSPELSFATLDEIDATTKDVQSVFATPVGWVTEAAGDVKRALYSVRQVLNLPIDAVNALWDITNQAISVMEAAWDTVPILRGRDDARRWFEAAYRATDEARQWALVTLYLAREQGQATAQGGEPVLSGVLREGESLQSFTERVLGSVDELEAVMRVNAMQSPFTAPSGAPLMPGQVIRYPVPGGVNAALGDELLGTDLRISERDLVLDGTTDFAVVRGRSNLIQAITRRLLAVRGSSLVWPQWGLPRLMGEAGIAGTTAYIASSLREQLRRDDRIRGVSRLSAEQRGGAYQAQATVKAIDGDSITVITPFQS